MYVGGTKRQVRDSARSLKINCKKLIGYLQEGWGNANMATGKKYEGKGKRRRPGCAGIPASVMARC